MIEAFTSLPVDAAVLCVLLICVIASITDIWRRKIPNELIGTGLVLTAFIQYQTWGMFGLKTALLGIGLAFW